MQSIGSIKTVMKTSDKPEVDEILKVIVVMETPERIEMLKYIRAFNDGVNYAKRIIAINQNHVDNSY